MTVLYLVVNKVFRHCLWGVKVLNLESDTYIYFKSSLLSVKCTI